MGSAGRENGDRAKNRRSFLSYYPSGFNTTTQFMYDHENRGPSFGANSHDFWSMTSNNNNAKACQNTFNALTQYHPANVFGAGSNITLSDIEVYTYTDITGQSVILARRL